MNWRDSILQQFIPNLKPFTLVSDPDRLLTEELLLQDIQAKGFEIVLFEDPIAFRFSYESNYRSWTRKNHSINLAVIISNHQPLSSLPYDLLQQGTQIQVSLTDLFPNLNHRVIRSLDQADLDALYAVQQKYISKPLGENATKDFVLRHLFQIAAELIQQPTDLLEVLLKRHYAKQTIPSLLDERLIQVLHASGLFYGWDLESIVPNAQAFFTFLQAQWSDFIQECLTISQPRLSEAKGKWSKPTTQIPFADNRVRVYLDNLFLEGYLKPLSISSDDHAKLLPDYQWLKIGLYEDVISDQARRLDKQMTALENAIPDTEARYKEWLLFSRRWAELIVLWHQVKLSHASQQTSQISDWSDRFQALQNRLDASFQGWMQTRYIGLHNQPGTVMLHHLPRALAQRVEQSAKVALLVLDGMAQDQWIVLRQVLQRQQPEMRFDEDAIFAWLPTITSVSRQAIFSGRTPSFFADSIHRTDKEPRLWSQFWAGQGLTANEVVYQKGLGKLDTLPQISDALAQIEETLSHPKVRVVGFVVDAIDKIMHGMTLGTSGMHSQVKLWAEMGFMNKLLTLLLQNQFQICLTSDHGNIEAVGIGKISEGVTADLQGERVRVYSDPILRANTQANVPAAIDWLPTGLPQNYLPLLASGRSAFQPKDDNIVGHGSLSLEEVIVPLVWIE